MKYHKFHLSKTTPPCLPLNSRFKPQEGQRQGQGQIGTGETVPPGGPGSGCWGGADPDLLGDARGSGGREARAAAPHGGLYHYGHWWTQPAGIGQWGSEVKLDVFMGHMEIICDGEIDIYIYIFKIIRTLGIRWDGGKNGSNWRCENGWRWVVDGRKQCFCCWLRLVRDICWYFSRSKVWN